jgi:hypothetical protein
MKKALLLTLVLMLGATMAFAGNGSIGIFADPAGASCNLPSTPGTIFLYWVHVNAVGATASQWASPAPTCVTAIRLADVPVFAINLGTTSAGITIGYGTCKSGTFEIMSALYSLVAAPTPCCYWPVIADPNLASGKIEIPDCDFNLTYGTGGKGIVNSGPTCNCNVPVEDTTWGQLKALYE